VKILVGAVNYIIVIFVHFIVIRSR